MDRKRADMLLKLSSYDYRVFPYLWAKKIESFVAKKLRDEIYRFDTAECGYAEAMDNCKKVIAKVYKVPIDTVIAENTDRNELRFTIKDHPGVVFLLYSDRLGREYED